MTIFKYYTKSGIERLVETDKNESLKQLSVNIWTGDPNNRDEQGNASMVSFERHKADTLQEAVKLFKEQYNEFVSKASDFKGHTLGSLRFYWHKDDLDFLTYVTLTYRGNEIFEFDMEELGF